MWSVTWSCDWRGKDLFSNNIIDQLTNVTAAVPESSCRLLAGWLSGSHPGPRSQTQRTSDSDYTGLGLYPRAPWPLWPQPNIALEYRTAIGFLIQIGFIWYYHSIYLDINSNVKLRSRSNLPGLYTIVQLSQVQVQVLGN